MKKKIHLLLISLTLLISNVFSQTVYITKTGEKYHIETCRFLSKSSFAIQLSDAIEKGYDPCKVCRPPTSARQEAPLQNQSRESEQEIPSQRKSNTKSANAEYNQCSATTKAGTRCKRMTKSPNGLCWQHGGE